MLKAVGEFGSNVANNKLEGHYDIYLFGIEIEYMYNVCIIKIQVPQAHEVRNQRVIAKRTSQIMKDEQNVIIQKWIDDNIQ